jgi:hypothetical protein
MLLLFYVFHPQTFGLLFLKKHLLHDEFPSLKLDVVAHMRLGSIVSNKTETKILNWVFSSNFMLLRSVVDL